MASNRTELASTALTILEAAGISLHKEYTPFVEQLIPLAAFADGLSAAFTVLKKAGAVLPVDVLLFRSVMKMAHHADNIAIGFATLVEAGATVASDSWTFYAIVKKPLHSDNLSGIFRTLNDLGASLKNHRPIYTQIILNAEYADKLSLVFTLLKDAGLTSPSSQFYTLILQKVAYLDGLAIAYKTLNQAGLDYFKYQTLYWSVTHRAQDAGKLPLLFTALQNIGVPYPETDLPHSSLYHTSIEKIPFAERMATGFAALQAEGATFANNRPLLRLVIQHAPVAHMIPIALEALKKVGATIQTHPEVYLECLPNAHSAYDFSSVFTVLENAGATFKKYPNLYVKSTGVNRGYDIVKLKIAIDALRQAGATFKDHQSIFEKVIIKHYFHNNLASIFNALNLAAPSFENNLQLYELILSSDSSLSELHMPIAELAKAGATLNAYQIFYCRLIEQAQFATQLAIGIRALRKEGATPFAHSVLFDTLIQHPGTANKLPELFKLMRSLGATVNKQPFFYQTGIQKAVFCRQLSEGFSAIQAAGATIEEDGPLFMAIMDLAQYADRLPVVFQALQAAGATVTKHRSLFQLSIGAVIFESSKIQAAITIVQSAGANPDEHEQIFRLAIQNAHYTNNLSDGFSALNTAGITLQAQPRLYELAIKNVLFADQLSTRLLALNDNGFSFQEQPELYELVIYQTNINSVALLDRLKTLGFKAPADLNLMIEILFSDKLDLLLWLEEYGFKKEDHYFIFENFFSGDKALIKSPYTMSKVKQELHRLLDERPLLPREHSLWLSQCKTVQETIDGVRKAENEITEGPLNKSEASWQIEALLQRIAVENINHVHLRFDEALGYILQFNDEPEIFLSELLKLANFNHIELSTEQIDLLGEKIQAVAPEFNSTVISSNNCIEKKLPGAARRAFTCYINTHSYFNINGLFRGVAQSSQDEHAWIKPVEGRKNLIAVFLTGCIMNWSAAKLPHLLHDSEERALLKSLRLDSCTNQFDYDEQLNNKKSEGLIDENKYSLLKPLFPELAILFPKYGLVDRGDNFNVTGQNELCTIQRFTANKGTFASALLSLSVFADGHENFHLAGSTGTKIETSNLRPIINIDEGEIIIPHGTCFGYALDISGTLFAREISSPGIVPNGGYWSSNALAEAFRNHLSKPYADEPAARITINSIHIERPNHGLAHAYRKMVYIDIVIDYFAHHAADQAFRLFCQNASPEEREWLRVTAAYSVTGRESELSPQENLGEYNRYKEAGKANMVAFLEKYPPANPDEAMRERMLHCVRWLGNPDYEQGAIINDHPDPEERVHRNFIHRILCVAHNLDLPRCREPEEFEQDMAVCRRLSVESVEQRDDYTRMVDYASQLIRAHGDLVGGYQAPFDKISRNLRQVREVTESVTRPLVREPYQFTTPHPQPFSP